MVSRRVREQSVLAGVCVLATFFLPAVQGPYSVTHGPITAMQAARDGVRLRATIVQYALNADGNSLVPPRMVLPGLSVLTPEVHPLIPPEYASILRC